MKQRVGRLAQRAARALARSLARESAGTLRLGDAVALVRAQGAAEADGGLDPLDPAWLCEFVARCCVEQQGRVRFVKGAPAHDDAPSRRFSSLVEVLERSVPPIPFARARDLGRYADRLRFDPTPFESWRWDTDVGLNFALSSSFAPKGRLLSAAIRVLRPGRCLELGTAYGMSSLFILSQLEASAPEGELTTVEFFEPQFTLASRMLSERHAGRVDCRKLDVASGLPTLAESLAPIDFVFHDADHTGEGYLRDFRALEPHVAPGGVVLFDDIRWTHASVDDPIGCHAGWLRVVAHPRVARAVEIDDNLGMLQLG